ncbi:MAG TPA: helix-turn-helix domain-containing protein [Nitrososphaeraceae archaeon]|nr:helix-turn-helix domain-containing protein [Nitrososphaeraceae archaeon]
MNIFGFNLDYSLSDTLISMIFFVLSFFTFLYIGYFRDIKSRDERDYKIKDMLIEGYLHKFDEYNDIISDLRSKLDVIDQKINPEKNIIKENRLATTVDSSDMVKDRSHKAISHNSLPVTKNMNVTREDIVFEEEDTLRTNTVESILRMLETPLTSRQIQRKISKSREHTSRLLKKLYSENIVMRDESAKPYKYKITDEGRRLLEQTRISDG